MEAKAGPQQGSKRKLTQSTLFSSTSLAVKVLRKENDDSPVVDEGAEYSDRESGVDAQPADDEDDSDNAEAVEDPPGPEEPESVAAIPFTHDHPAKDHAFFAVRKKRSVPARTSRAAAENLEDGQLFAYTF